MATSTDQRFGETGPATILAIGAWDHGEYAVLRAEIDDLTCWKCVEDCETACELLHRSDVIPDFILLAQSVPRTFPQAEIEELRRLAPLAQIVVVGGTWCEGELRTGLPLAGILRLYWYEFTNWWRVRSLDNRAWSPCLDGSLAPRTTQVEQTLACELAIHTPTLASFEAISAGLSPLGAKCVWVRDSEVPPVRVGIWDGAQLAPPEWSHLISFVASLRRNDSALIALLDFPRKEHISRLQAIGCNALFGKPYIAAELAAMIARLLQPSEFNPGT